MRCAFVRGLWGDDLTQARPGGRTWYSLLDEVRRTVEWPHQALPVEVYSFGGSNHAALREIGIESTMLSPHALINYTGQPARNPSPWRAWTNWGASMWRQKFECIRAGLEHNEAVVWLDWNVRLVKPLPADFWDRVNAGPPLKSNVGGNYIRKQCPWRKIQPRTVHHCWWLYVRGKAVIDRLIQLSEQRPQEYDEPIVARWIDEQYGGQWKGTIQYKEDGYEPYCNFDTWRGGIHPPDELVFRTWDK